MKLMEKFPFLRHKSNKKFLMMYVLALIKLRDVQFCETASFLNDKVKDKSNETRIQDFFRTVSIDYKSLALLFYRTFAFAFLTSPQPLSNLERGSYSSLQNRGKSKRKSYFIVLFLFFVMYLDIFYTK
jgi:hypothetical protein